MTTTTIGCKGDVDVDGHTNLEDLVVAGDLHSGILVGDLQVTGSISLVLLLISAGTLVMQQQVQILIMLYLLLLVLPLQMLFTIQIMILDLVLHLTGGEVFCCWYSIGH